MSLENDLATLADLLGEFEDRVEVIGTRPDVRGAELAGSTPQASENRTIRHTQAHLARVRAREMREDLGRFRERARQMADLARAAAASTGACPRDPGEDGIGVAAQRLADAEDLEEVVRVVVDAALDLVQGEGWAGVCLGQADGSVTVADPADPVVTQFLALEHVEGGGPVLAAVGQAELVRVQDLSEHPVWGRWGEAARVAGIRGVLAHGFRGRRTSRGGALVVLVGAETALRPSMERRVGILADQAAIALAGVHRTESLLRAIEDRDLIGQAKGLISTRLGLTPDQAFQELVTTSQNANMKLRDVARWLVKDVDPTSG